MSVNAREAIAALFFAMGLAAGAGQYPGGTIECAVLAIGSNTFDTLACHNINGSMGGTKAGGFENTWPEEDGDVLWILDLAVSTRAQTLALGRRTVVDSPGRMIVNMVTASTVGAPGVRGTIKAVDLANGRVTVEVPWVWSQPRMYGATLDATTECFWKGVPCDPKQALGMGRSVEVVPPRALTISVLSEKVAAHAPNARGHPLLAGKVHDITGLPRNTFKLAVETNGAPAVLDIAITRLTPVLLDARGTPVEEALRVGRSVLCLGGARPHRLIVSSGQPGDPRGVLKTVKEEGQTLRLGLEDRGKTDDITVSLAENPAFTLDHRPSTREAALRPGCHVTVLARRPQRILVTEPPSQSLW
jgi:hypothetical protein